MVGDVRFPSDPLARAEDAEEPFALAYAHLHRLAQAFMSHERADHTLQPTALVNEAYLRLADQERSAFRDRNHFLVVASRAMRRILIDHARKSRSQRRGGAWIEVMLTDELAAESRAIDVQALARALEKLEGLDPLEAQIVQLRFFSGLTETEAGRELGISERTVRLRWAHARSWLRKELNEPASA